MIVPPAPTVRAETAIVALVGAEGLVPVMTEL
jgi:hypothetical protein